jgi:hypothetical protein
LCTSYPRVFANRSCLFHSLGDTQATPASKAAAGAAGSNELVGMAAAKKSFKEVGKSVKQMNSGVAGFGTTQKDRRSTDANPTITPTQKSAAASNVGTPGSIGAQNMTQFFEENGDVGDPPKGTLLGHKDNKGSGQDAVAAGAAPPAQKINNAEPKRVAVRVFQARDIAAADSGFFSGPTSDP